MSKTDSCAVCGKPVADGYRPFCSARCADIDLQRWFTGRYTIPAEDDDPEPERRGLAGQPDEG